MGHSPLHEPGLMTSLREGRLFRSPRALTFYRFRFVLRVRLTALLGLMLLVRAAPLTAGDGLEREIGRIIEAPEFKQAHWGIFVVDVADGRTVYELNADR